MMTINRITNKVLIVLGLAFSLCACSGARQDVANPVASGTPPGDQSNNQNNNTQLTNLNGAGNPIATIEITDCTSTLPPPVHQ